MLVTIVKILLYNIKKLFIFIENWDFMAYVAGISLATLLVEVFPHHLETWEAFQFCKDNELQCNVVISDFVVESCIYIFSL